MAFLAFQEQTTVLNAYAALIGSTPGNASFKAHTDYIVAKGIPAYKAALESLFAGTSNATLATSMLANLNLGTWATQAQAEAFLAANTGNRVGAIIDLAAALYSYGGSDAALKAASANYQVALEYSYNFSANTGNVTGQALPGYAGQTITLTTGVDNVVGSAFNDTIVARTINNGNSLNDGDKIDGGAGTDTIYADFVAVTGGAAHTPALTNIEAVAVRGETHSTEGVNDNNLGSNLVQIDAQRSLAVNAANQVTADVGVLRWESNNSRADVVIEDVRIGNTNKTKDVLIAMVETDPGNVDFGVYFDQLSLRNSGTSQTSLTIQVMDTGAAATAATAATPLLNNPYDLFKLGINGTLASIQLDKTAVAAADTYEALLAVFNTALTGTGITAAISGTFTITDPISGKAVTGKNIVLTSGGGVAISTPTGSGWYNTTNASVPATSNIFTSFATSGASTTELVTSQVLLDDVGRGSTGGDLVIGGLSVGSTSTSRGVERFEVTVGDNSRLQTMNSTNNALREVTIVSGTTSNTVANAYRTTVKDQGDLTVNGTNFVSPLGTVDNMVVDGDLPGVNTTASANNLVNGANGATGAAVAHTGAGAAGFTDVRLIDASAFKGNLAFTAAISRDSILKYVNSVDTQANPASDVAGTGNVNFNVRGANFIYTGGTGNDSMVVSIDRDTASSRSTINSGLSDFTFSFNGGDGNDTMVVGVAASNLKGNQQAWYNNQKLNNNITIDAGNGDDTVRTPGAGDKNITLGAGNDTVYTDNTGNLGATARAQNASSNAAQMYRDAAAAEYTVGINANVASNNTGWLAGVDGVFTPVTTTAVVTALATLDAVTPQTGTPVGGFPVITHAAIAAATAAAAAAGAITLTQKIALDTAYNAATGGTITAAAALGAASTLGGQVAVAGNLTAAEMAAGDAVFNTIYTAAKAAEATALANDAFHATMTPLLNATQVAARTAYMNVNGVDDPTTGANEAGTQTIVNALNTLASALVVGATQAQAIAALNTATIAGAITPANAALVLAAVPAFPIAAAGVTAVTNILSPLQNTAALNNTAAQAALTTALTNDTNAVNAEALLVAATPVTPVAAAAQDGLGQTGTAAALTAATNARNAATVDVTTATTVNTVLASLKSSINVGSTDVQVFNAIKSAAASIATAVATGAATGTGVVTNPLTGAVQNAMMIAAGVAAGALDGAGNLLAANSLTNAAVVTAATEQTFDTGAGAFLAANSVDSLTITNTALLDRLTITAANLANNVTATQLAATNAANAAVNAGSNSLDVAAPRAVFVFNTTDQTATYNRTQQDDRNLADLRSDANHGWNFFNSTVRVIYKGIEATTVVAGTSYKTSDLEINQAIKNAINNDAVLSKLISAADGPANTLVITSAIDGTHVTGNLAVSVTMPTTVATTDLAAAAAAYGLAAGSTEAQVLAAMTAGKTAFDTKGDYVTQFAESGAASTTGVNALLTGANSTATTDNTITPGTGNDVMVLSTTAGVDTLTSSNETVVFAADSLGADTIVNFAAAGVGIDRLDFTALNGRGNVALNSLSADKSIVIAAPTAAGATPLTATQIAALFTDSATAINHVYVAVDSTNIGSIWKVADAAGTAAGNITATLVGTIDLADTAWGTLTAANFV